MDLVGGNLAKDDFLVQMYQKNGNLSSESFLLDRGCFFGRFLCRFHMPKKLASPFVASRLKKPGWSFMEKAHAFPMSCHAS